MIWCVEDDASIRDIEIYALRSAGFEARGFADGDSFWAAAQRERPTLVVLDIMLPGVDGVELLRRMRADPALSAVPVVMATAKGAEYDKVQALDLGADYYLTKPFGVMEFLSCVRSVLRRCGGEPRSSALSQDGLRLDPGTQRVMAGARQVALGPVEFRLLNFLMHHPERVHTRSQLLDQVWGRHAVLDERTVDTHVGRLRNALQPSGHQRRIETVRGSGYRFVAWGAREACDWTSAA